MCGNFHCSKSTLIGLNTAYIIVAFILIGTATVGKTSAIIESLPIIGGIAASGFFLLIISVIGLYGAFKHNQVMLFFYMIVLFLIFVIQFSVACACLAVDEEQEIHYANEGWNRAPDSLKFEAEKYFQCCGFRNDTEGVRCAEIPICNTVASCPPCVDQFKGKINGAFNTAGGLGLFFSFTEFVAIIFAARFRTQIKEMSQIA